MNLCAYVGNDPVNYVDPLGLAGVGYGEEDDIVVVAPRRFSNSVCGGPGQMSCSEYMATQMDFEETCREGLRQSGQDFGAVRRARAEMRSIREAARRAGIDPRLLAAVGVRESGFRNVTERGGGGGRGVFQLDIRTGGYSESQAMSVSISANLAAQHLRRNMDQISRQHPNLIAAGAMTQATAASYNFGTNDISGNVSTIDQGTANNNYGISVVNLMYCFSLAR